MMKETPFFSIVLSIYGVENYLDRCINSILKQDFRNFELILVDDGSRDKCPEMCDEWSLKDKRIKVIHKKNEGLGYARNTGLNNAKGKYIFFIDSDDYVLNGLLTEAYSKLSNKNVNALFYGFQRVDQNGKVLSVHIPKPDKEIYNDKSEIKEKLFADFIARNPQTGKSKNLRISAWGCCLNIDFLRKNNLKFVSEREYICEDIYFFTEMFDVLESALILKKVYYTYCQNEGSLTFTYKSDRYNRLKNFYRTIDELAQEKDYSMEVRMRFKASFIACIIGCLKMEAANFKKIGFKESYKKVVRICEDYDVVNAIKVYPLKKYGRTWDIFGKCVSKKLYLLLYILLLLQYYKSGV